MLKIIFFPLILLGFVLMAIDATLQMGMMALKKTGPRWLFLILFVPFFIFSSICRAVLAPVLETNSIFH